MDKWDLNPLDRELHDLKAAIAVADGRLDLLERNREVVERIMQTCKVSSVCTVCDCLSLWIDREDLPKARAVLGRLKVVAKHAAGATQLCVFLKSDRPDIGIAYYRPAPDPALSRCKIVREEKVETHTHYSLVCPN
jgi:hypothetical protein